RLSSAPIPFDELFVPSGFYDMRGFPTGRGRGESGLVGSAEYRWYIAASLDATLFVDVGPVAGHPFTPLPPAHGPRPGPLVAGLRPRLPLIPASGRLLGGASGRRYPDRLRTRGGLAPAA